MKKIDSYPQKSDSQASSRSLDYRRKAFGFFRPHSHYGFDNCDPNTGEVLPSMTRQSEMESCDIHNILKQFSQQGFEQLVRENAARGQYADVPTDLDYQDSLNTVLAAQTAFATLPSQVRERFQNDPARFLEFLANPDNVEEAIRLGLATARPEPDASLKDVVDALQTKTGGEGGSPPSGGAKAP